MESSSKLPGRVTMISGPPGAGKSTICQRMATLAQKSAVIPLDDIRDWVKQGYAAPIEDWSDETTRQMALASQVAFLAASRHSEAGFDVFLDHVFMPDDLKACQLSLKRPVFGVLLLPTKEVNLIRNWNRANKDFDTTVLDATVESLQAFYRKDTKMADSGWQVVDNSVWTIEETIAEIESLRIAFYAAR